MHEMADSLLWHGAMGFGVLHGAVGFGVLHGAKVSVLLHARLEFRVLHASQTEAGVPYRSLSGELHSYVYLWYVMPCIRPLSMKFASPL